MVIGRKKLLSLLVYLRAPFWDHSSFSSSWRISQPLSAAVVLPLFLLMTPLSMIVVPSPACHPAVVCSKIWITMTSGPQHQQRPSTRWSHQLCSWWKEVSSLHIQCYGSWPGHRWTERENTASGCHIDNGAMLQLDSPRRLNSPSELQGIHAETIGLSLWKQHFCKASLHKSCSAGTGVRWTRLGFLHPGRLSAGWKTPAFGC